MHNFISFHLNFQMYYVIIYVIRKMEQASKCAAEKLSVCPLVAFSVDSLIQQEKSGKPADTSLLGGNMHRFVKSGVLINLRSFLKNNIPYPFILH